MLAETIRQGGQMQRIAVAAHALDGQQHQVVHGQAGQGGQDLVAEGHAVRLEARPADVHARRTRAASAGLTAYGRLSEA